MWQNRGPSHLVVNHALCETTGWHAGGQGKYADVCLVDVLRAHGYKCEYEGDGPFWAQEDGNRFLRPFQQLGDKCVL